MKQLSNIYKNSCLITHLLEKIATEMEQIDKYDDRYRIQSNLEPINKVVSNQSILSYN